MKPALELAPELIETIKEPRRQRAAILLKILMWGGGLLCSYLFYKWMRERLRSGQKYLWDNVSILVRRS